MGSIPRLSEYGVAYAAGSEQCAMSNFHCPSSALPSCPCEFVEATPSARSVACEAVPAGDLIPHPVTLSLSLSLSVCTCDPGNWPVCACDSSQPKPAQKASKSPNQRIRTELISIFGSLNLSKRNQSHQARRSEL